MDSTTTEILTLSPRLTRKYQSRAVLTWSGSITLDLYTTFSLTSNEICVVGELNDNCGHAKHTHVRKLGGHGGEVITIDNLGAY